MIPTVAREFRPAFGDYSPARGFESVDRRDIRGTLDWERMYAQSASGSRSSQRTAPEDSRSSKMQSSARNDWWRLAAFLRYPSVVPHAATYAARSSFDKELRYLSNLSMGILYPQVKPESIPTGHLPSSKLLIECGMDKFEIRRLNLQAVLRTHCNGKAAALADKIGGAPSYVSRMLYPEGKRGKKRIGEDMRDRIEDALALPRGYMDDVARAAAEVGASAEAEESTRPTPSPALSHLVDVSAEGVTIERFDAEELKIVELYRRADKDGRMIIFGAATVAPKGEMLPIPPAGKTTLGPINASEKRVLDLYRRADKEGKAVILGAAMVAPKEDQSDAAGNTD